MDIINEHHSLENLKADNSWNASDSLIQHLVIEAFAKLRKVTISFVMLVCPSALTEQLDGFL